MIQKWRFDGRGVEILPDRIKSIEQQNSTDGKLVHTKNNQGIYIYVAKAIRGFIFTPNEVTSHFSQKN